MLPSSHTAVLSASLISIFSCIYHRASTIEKKPRVVIAVLHTLPFSFPRLGELNLAVIPWTGPPLQSVVLPCSSLAKRHKLAFSLAQCSWSLFPGLFATHLLFICTCMKSMLHFKHLLHVCCCFFGRVRTELDLKTDPTPIAKLQTKVLNKH